ncbi:D-cysteine desulfhydrase [Brevibacterium linens]|uniref:D-cysteine desulfhydrase n=1 Tax=Brevibacterium linens ATCC 9172 TaxID=1255617 RepID=A0A2H1JJE3_BRELN|nr:D-cysteine desulfhydrase [Brevibacterium linens]AZU00334.1 D-cysteine desulfhydrase [Brevibacterium linens]KAB1947350.1 D-cysteine desulfhydrase [Brevibacterium linens ATCC 9172]SMX87531.1 D-cysteine desulfhydrase [Brevibacterium linens ATCC 9172]
MVALNEIPRRRYTAGATPLEHLRRLSAELGGPQIWIKRDDRLGLTQGGNKTRKLEYLIADALNQGADTLITVGGVQSNHCRLTLSAARAEGLDCHLIVEEDLGPDGTALGPAGANPPEHTGNFLLFDLLGADSVTVLGHGADLLGEAEILAEKLRGEGRIPYIIPVGGSNPIGALGYVDCAHELLDQFAEEGVDSPTIVTPSGSAGMQAGLIVGLHSAGSTVPIIGINVSRSQAEQEPKIVDLVDSTARFLDLPHVPRDATTGLGDYVGTGYALPTPEMAEAVRLFARTEGILLDPVYTGKAAAGLIDLIRSGRFPSEDTVVFVHSGGVPGLYARTQAFT